MTTQIRNAELARLLGVYAASTQPGITNIVNQIISVGAGFFGHIGFELGDTVARVDNFYGGVATQDAFPVAGLLDDFNRSDEGPPPSSSWTNNGANGPGVISNVAGAVTAGGQTRWNIPIEANQECRFTLSVLPGDTSFVSLLARFNTTFDAGYELIVTRNDAGDDLVSLWDTVDAVELDNAIITLQAGDEFGLRCYSNTILGYYRALGETDFILIVSAVDETTGNGPPPQDGQIQIGNGLDYTVNEIDPGTAIGITNGPGTIQIAVNDPELLALAGLVSAADQLPYFTGSGAAALTPLTAFIRTLLDDADQAAAQATLGLTPGTNTQPFDAFLTSIALLGTAADRMIYTTGVDTAAETPLTAFARSILDDASEAAFKATVNLEIGVDVQAWDADLDALAALAGTGIAVRSAANTWVQRSITAGTAIVVTNGDGVSGNPSVAVNDVELLALAGLVSAADRLPYFTGSGTAALATFTAFARTLVDDADATTARTTLGLAIGTNVQAWDADLDALAALSATAGMLSRTGTGAFAVRTLTAPAAGITISNNTGAAGNPTWALANDLAALEGLASTGIAVRSAVDTWVQRSIVSGTAITVSNGDGVAGNPSVAVSDAELLALAGLISAADRLPYFTGSGTASLATFTAFARTLLDDASAAVAKTTLGIKDLVSPFMSIPHMRTFWAMSSINGAGTVLDFSETARSLSRNGNPLCRISGLVSYLDLDGTGDFFHLNTQPDMDLGDGTDAHIDSSVVGATFGLWVWLDSVAAGTKGLLGKWNATSNQRAWLLWVDGATPKGSVSTNGTAVVTVTSSVTLSAGQWYFIVVRFTPSSELAIFVNKTKSVNTTSIPATLMSGNSANVQVGGFESANLMDGRVGPAFTSAAALSDEWCDYLFDESKDFFGVL